MSWGIQGVRRNKFMMTPKKIFFSFCFHIKRYILD